MKSKLTYYLFQILEVVAAVAILAAFALVVTLLSIGPEMLRAHIWTTVYNWSQKK